MKHLPWTREQTIVALNLYCKIPFNKVSSSHPEIIKYSSLIGRSPNSLKMKIGNFGSFDIELKKRGIVGLAHTAKLDEEIWNEYSSDWEKLAYESEMLISSLEGISIYKKIVDIDYEQKDNGEVIRNVKTRINQNFFRSTVLSSYNNTCGITGLQIPELLVASHIIPWKDRIDTRINPRNGICLNALHDKAFDRGFITITSDFKVKVSKYIFSKYNDSAVIWIKQYDGMLLNLPEKFYPEIDFIKYHNKEIFEKWKD